MSTRAFFARRTRDRSPTLPHARRGANYVGPTVRDPPFIVPDRHDNGIFRLHATVRREHFLLFAATIILFLAGLHQPSNPSMQTGTCRGGSTWNPDRQNSLYQLDTLGWHCGSA